MGLSVTGYSKLTEVPSAERDADGCFVSEDVESFWENPDFPGRMEGLKPEAAYDVSEGQGSAHSFDMSYGRYNAWRDELAKLAGYPLTAYQSHRSERQGHDAGAWAAGKGPFFEQICFSDCDGTIGPVVAAKLAKDYAEFAAKAEAIGDYFWMRYQDWQKCFELAADNGAVKFH